MYTEFAPSPLLARVVDAYWRFDGQDAPHRVLPDGCMDFLFDLQTGSALIVGAMSAADLIHTPRGASAFGVRFRPGFGASYVQARACQLVDQQVSLRDLGAAHHTLHLTRIAEAPSDTARCQILDAYLLDASTRIRPRDMRVLRAVSLTARRHGKVTIRGLADEVNLSERQLERLFLEHVGVGPKLYARVARMERALTLASTTRATQADLAARTGYADESHLVREFSALSGLTLHELLRERHGVGFVQAPALASRT